MVSWTAFPPPSKPAKRCPTTACLLVCMLAVGTAYWVCHRSGPLLPTNLHPGWASLPLPCSFVPSLQPPPEDVGELRLVLNRTQRQNLKLSGKLARAKDESAER